MSGLRVNVFAPPSDHGGIGRYAEQLRTRMTDTVDISHVPLYEELGVADYARAALQTADYDIVHLQFEYGLFRPKILYAWVFLPILLLQSRLQRVPVIVTVHEVWTTKTVGRFQYGYVLLIHALLAATATRLVFMTEDAAADFQPYSLAVTEHIPHGVDMSAVRDINFEEARASFDYTPEDVVISQIGYVSPRKGTKDFLELASRHPEREFLLAGGPLREEDEPYFEEVLEEAPQNFRATGVLPDEAFHAAFVTTDIAILAYRDIRQSGILNWCFAYGVPAICRAIDHFEKLSEQGAPLVLFDEGDDYQSIDEAVDTALTEAVDREEEMKDFGGARDLSQIAVRYTELYRLVA